MGKTLQKRLKITSPRVLVISLQHLNSVGRGTEIRIEEDKCPEWVRGMSFDRFRMQTLRREHNEGQVPSIAHRKYERRAEVEGLGVIYLEVYSRSYFPGLEDYAQFNEEMNSQEF